MNLERIQYKAQAFRGGWRRKYARDPSLNEQCIGLGVAIGETVAGDAWPGADGIVGTADDERNWGAKTLRGLSFDECLIIADSGRALIAGAGLDRTGMVTERGDRLVFRTGPQRFEWVIDDKVVYCNAAETKALWPLTPIVSKGHAERARNVQHAIASLIDCPATVADEKGRHGAIHCDSSPKYGPYFVWFEAWTDAAKTNLENDTDAAASFVQTLTRSPAEEAALANGDALAMARAMYVMHYYTGFHDPAKDYPDGAGGTVKGDELNIRTYGGMIARIAPTVRAALTTR